MDDFITIGTQMKMRDPVRLVLLLRQTLLMGCADFERRTISRTDDVKSFNDVKTISL